MMTIVLVIATAIMVSSNVDAFTTSAFHHHHHRSLSPIIQSMPSSSGFITTTTTRAAFTINAISERGRINDGGMIITRTRTATTTSSTTTMMKMNRNDNNNDNNANSDNNNIPLWSTMVALSTVGALETAYLTYIKLSSSSSTASSLWCPISGGGCNNVLNGPYSTIHLPFLGGDNVIPDIPLSLLGCLAYSSIVLLSGINLNTAWNFRRDNDSSNNNNDDVMINGVSNVILLGLVTSMATFSFYLLYLLNYVLQLQCPYCILSAFLSVTLALIAWNSNIGTAAIIDTEDGSGSVSGIGLIKEDVDQKNNNVGNNKWFGEKMNTAATNIITSSVAFSTITAVLLFYTANPSSVAADTSSSSSMMASLSTSIASSTSEPSAPDIKPKGPFSSPTITTKSTPKTLQLANDLSNLNSRMYGAYWCSHCFDQKMTLGKEAFNVVKYVECAKDGVDTQYKLCKSKNVPGYPTWEIGGRLFPGEMFIDELEEIVAKFKSGDLKVVSEGSSTSSKS